MNETKEKTTNRLSARSKVIDNWNSGWKSISKTPPIRPIGDIQMSRSQKQKSDKRVKDLNKSFDSPKVVTKENDMKSSQKLETNQQKDNKFNTRKDSLKDNSLDVFKDKDIPNDNSKNKTKEIRNSLNGSQRDNNVTNDSIKQKSNSDDNKIEVQNNSILSKLRKRKTDSNNNSNIDNSFNKTVLETKSVESLEENTNKDLEEKKRKSSEKKIIEEVVLKINEDIEPMEVDLDLSEMCIRPNCSAKVSRFQLFENKFCSSECAINQWTEDFRNYWKT